MQKVGFSTKNNLRFIDNDRIILKDLGYELVEEELRLSRLPFLFVKWLRKFRGCLFIYSWFATERGFIATLIAKILGIPSIVIAGGYDVCSCDEIKYGYKYQPFWRKIMIKWTLKNATLILAVSKEAYKSARKIGVRNISVVYNCVDIDKYVPKNKNRDIVLTVGSFRKMNLRKKGYLAILESSKEVIKRYPEIKFYFIGNKADGYKKFEEIVKKFNLEKNIISPGPMNEYRLIKYYQKALLYIQYSIHESFGVALAEAMSCGCPVIVKNTSALPEVVGDAGLYVNDVKELSDKIIYLYENKKIRKKMGKKTRERIVNNFSKEIRKENLKRIMDGLV